MGGLFLLGASQANPKRVLWNHTTRLRIEKGLFGSKTFRACAEPLKKENKIDMSKTSLIFDILPKKSHRLGRKTSTAIMLE
jgi:hypothetical protein